MVFVVRFLVSPSSKSAMICTTVAFRWRQQRFNGTRQFYDEPLKCLRQKRFLFSPKILRETIKRIPDQINLLLFSPTGD